MLPPKSAFVTPVLSTASPSADAQPRRGGGGGGPVIEYVRGPMRIAMAPVASANPNDAGVGRRRGKKQRRWERGPGGPPRRFDERPRLDAGGSGAADNNSGNNGNGQALEPNGERRKRRRRRRRRHDVPMQAGAPLGNGNANGNGGNTHEPGAEPVRFFEPNGPANQSPPIMLGPDGQPMRKRRRRRRRGRGGRNREWRGPNGGPGGGDGGGGSPPSDGGGGDGGGGSLSDG
jgi:hypothetical protein